MTIREFWESKPDEDFDEEDPRPTEYAISKIEWFLSEVDTEFESSSVGGGGLHVYIGRPDDDRHLALVVFSSEDGPKPYLYMGQKNVNGFMSIRGVGLTPEAIGRWVRWQRFEGLMLPCPECDGTGLDEGIDACPRCVGKGCGECVDGAVQIQIPCPFCDGWNHVPEIAMDDAYISIYENGKYVKQGKE